MSTIEVKVPDIGDFKDVPIIEILVKPGDTVKPEDPLVTLESDKATMDVPSPQGGVVKELKTKVGDKVSEGRVLLTLDAATDKAMQSEVPARAPSAPSAPSTPVPAAPAPAKSPAATPAAGAQVTEVKVPDIGDFKDVPVIEVLVKAGDTVKAEDPLVTLESDKATMDVPSPAGGVVKELKLKIGDKVSEGSVILTLRAAGEVAAAKPPAPPPSPQAAPPSQTRAPAAAPP